MHRLLVPPESVQGRRVILTDPRRVHHLLRVLRAKPGDAVQCADGAGRRLTGSVKTCSRREVTIEITEQIQEGPAAVRLTLAQALIQPQRFDWLVEKATELGMARLVPFTSARTTARGNEAGRQRVARWRRIAEEATAQCGRTMLPVIEEPASFEALFDRLGPCAGLLPTMTETGRPLGQHLPLVQTMARRAMEGEGTAKLAVVIGPEGDFTPEEVARATRAGFGLVRLGPRILRSETAALATIAVIQQALDTL